jgi:hypothetical protein
VSLFNCRRAEVFAIVEIRYFVEENIYNLMNGFSFIGPFQNEKDLSGIPKIALRKSETKTLESPLTPLCKRGGYKVECPFSEAAFPVNFLLFQKRIKEDYSEFLGSLDFCFFVSRQRS